jgi:hypothetical protein
MKKPNARSKYLRKVIDMNIEYETVQASCMGISHKRRLVKRNAILDCGHAKPITTGGRWRTLKTTFCDQCAEDAGDSYLI